MLYYDATHYVETIDTLVERADEAGSADGGSDEFTYGEWSQWPRAEWLLSRLGIDPYDYRQIAADDWSAIRAAYGQGYQHGRDRTQHLMFVDGLIQASCDAGIRDGRSDADAGMSINDPTNYWVLRRVNITVNGLTHAEEQRVIVAYGIGYRRTNKYAVAAS